MKLRKVLGLRGPNVWGTFPLLEVWLDLGGTPDQASPPQSGFIEQLLAWIPSIGNESPRSFAVRPGDSIRLERVLARCCLELQRLAGTAVEFGCTAGTSQPGVHKVLIEYQDEQLARAALQTAQRLCLAALHNGPFDVSAEVEKLCELYGRIAPKPATVAIVAAAKRRGIPLRFLNTNGLLQLGHGARQRRLQGAQTDRTGATAESIARDNHLTRTLLQAVGVPTPPGELVSSADAAWEEALDMGLPVSLRPRYGRERRPEWSRLHSREQIEAAYRAASDDGDDPVLVERVPEGVSHRFLVINGRTAAAVRREAGRTVEVTSQVHPDLATRVAEAVRVIGLDVGGVEVIASDVQLPLETQGGVVLEVQAQPELEEFLQPDEGAPQPVADALLASLFPAGDGRIPVVSITGTNGKTTTTRLIAHILDRVYGPVGMACSEGIYVGDRLIESGDCSGPKSARMVLGHPAARAAVLETARGGILREGLGFDYCNAAVFTNVAKADHLGLNDLHTPEQVAEVKGTVVKVVLPEGAAVLNAADPLVAGMAERCSAGVVFFARDANHPVIVAHRAAGQRAVFEREGQIILAEGQDEMALVPLSRVPLTHRGRVGFNVENALAAAAAAWTVGVPLEDIRAGLETFASVLEHSPGRFNLLEYRGATIVMDYAHNTSALESFLEVLRQFPHASRSVVYAVPGDRTDAVIIEQAELLGNAYDRVILYEDTELRGRPEGAIFALMRRGLARGNRTREILEVRGNIKAIETALSLVEPGELMVIQPEFPDVGAEYFGRLVAAGAREITLDQVSATPPAVVTATVP